MNTAFSPKPNKTFAAGLIYTHWTGNGAKAPGFMQFEYPFETLAAVAAGAAKYTTEQLEFALLPGLLTHDYVSNPMTFMPMFVAYLTKLPQVQHFISDPDYLDCGVIVKYMTVEDSAHYGGDIVEVTNTAGSFERITYLKNRKNARRLRKHEIERYFGSPVDPILHPRPVTLLSS